MLLTTFGDVKSDKRFKGNKSTGINDNYKDIIKFTQSLDNIPKQANDHILQLVDSYSYVSEQRTKPSQLILEKVDRNITVPHTEKPIKVVYQVPLKYIIVKDPNIFKDLFINRVNKFEITVGYFVLELLNTMIFFK